MSIYAHNHRYGDYAFPRNKNNPFFTILFFFLRLAALIVFWNFAEYKTKYADCKKKNITCTVIRFQ